MCPINSTQTLGEMIGHMNPLNYSWDVHLALLITIPLIWYVLSKKKTPPGLKAIPWASGWRPFIGHGHLFSTDIIAYVKKLHNTYGGICKVQIFNNVMVIVSDRKLVKPLMQAKESTLSLYDKLNGLYFGSGFSDDCRSMGKIIRIVKKTVAVNFDDFIPKIMGFAQKGINEMKEKIKDGTDVNIYHDIIKFITVTSSGCFVGIDLDDDFYKTLTKFSELLNKIVVMTYFFPVWVLRNTIGRRLRRYRVSMIEYLTPTIQSYRDDPNKKDSLIIRNAVDHACQLNNREIGEVIVCLLYVSAENTALGLASMVKDLSENHKWWNFIREKSGEYMKNDDLYGIFTDPDIHAVMMESARTNTHIFPLNRVPKKHTYILNEEYHVGKVDSIAVCSPMLTNFDAATDKFKDPETYDPSRFMGKDSEKKGPYDVLAWGAGTHHCPGKGFAQYELKAFMAVATNIFKPFVMKEKGKKNYFSPSAFADQEYTVNVTQLPIDEQITKINLNPCVTYRRKNYKALRYQTDDGCGWLIKGLLDENSQKEFYEMTVNASNGSKEHIELASTVNDTTVTHPLTYTNQAYTGESNCEPTSVSPGMKLASEVWTMLHKHKRMLRFPSDIASPKFNSFYSQLYPGDSTMNPHKDKYVDWGVSISLGASCMFTFGDHEISLSSGDVFVADFSKVTHSVDAIDPETTPDWFKQCNTFGRIRCSVQIREVDRSNQEKAIGSDEFKDLLKQNEKTN